MRDDAQARVPQVGRDGLGQPGADPVVGRLPAHVRERHDHDRAGRLRERRQRQAGQDAAGQDQRDGAPEGFAGHAVV